MGLRALVIIQDGEAVRVVRRVLDELNMQYEITSSLPRAEEMLAKHRFDAVVVDCDDLEGAPEMLRHLRKSPSNKRSLAFSIVNGRTTVRDAFDLGANFVLDKPLTVERVQRSFRAAHGLMMRERRRYYRNPVHAIVMVITADGRQVRARLVNLSEGGMAVTVGEPLATNTNVRIQFKMPHNGSPVEAKAVVSWVAEDKIGLRFLHMEQRMQRELEQWIAQQSEAEIASNGPIFINASAKAR